MQEGGVQVRRQAKRMQLGDQHNICANHKQGAVKSADSDCAGHERPLIEWIGRIIGVPAVCHERSYTSQEREMCMRNMENKLMVERWLNIEYGSKRTEYSVQKHQTV